MNNIFGHPMTVLPPDVERCPAERWYDEQQRHVRCEYAEGHSGAHTRATAMWAVVWEDV